MDDVQTSEQTHLQTDAGESSSPCLEDNVRKLQAALDDAEQRAASQEKRADELTGKLEAAEKRVNEETTRADDAENEVRRLAARVAELQQEAEKHARAGEDAPAKMASSPGTELDRLQSVPATQSSPDLSTEKAVVGCVGWFCELDGRLVQYDDADCEALEKSRALLPSRTSSSSDSSRQSSSRSRTVQRNVCCEVRRGKSVVDLVRMVQVNKITGFERAVHRKDNLPPPRNPVSAPAFQRSIPGLQVQKDFKAIIAGMQAYPTHSGVQVLLRSASSQCWRCCCCARAAAEEEAR